MKKKEINIYEIDLRESDDYHRSLFNSDAPIAFNYRKSPNRFVFWMALIECDGGDKEIYGFNEVEKDEDYELTWLFERDQVGWRYNLENYNVIEKYL